MNRIDQAIQAGYAAYKRGEHAVARRHLAAVNHPKAIHLLGLVEKDAGNLQAATDLLDRAAKVSPQDHEVAHNQGLVASLLGNPRKAEAAYRRALRLQSNFTQARISLGRLLIDQERWEDARALYDELVRTAPNSVPARYGFATVLLALGATEKAEKLFNVLIEEGNDEPEIRFMRARTRLEFGRIEEALDDLRISYQADPTALNLKTLAGTLWMKDDRAALDELLNGAVADSGLVLAAAEILRQCGDPERALNTIDSATARLEMPAEAFAITAMAHIDAGNPKEAELAAVRCLAAESGQRVATGCLITALMMQGRAEEAMHHIAAMRAAEPDGQHWIAYETTALRLQGSPEYERTVDMERFVRLYTLPTPDGFDSLETYNEQFLEALERWHLYKCHPLDQSLRGGSQTPRDLTFVDDPTIQAYVAALDGPIRQYMKHVGTAIDHPLTRRNTGRYKIAGCWSVRLEGGGRHVNHVHPEGWISSSYYVAVPAKTEADKAGWIKFGQPPFETEPATPPQKWIRPEPGLLVLFPSFLWHGTEPIHDGSVRVTAPFDAVPV